MHFLESLCDLLRVRSIAYQQDRMYLWPVDPAQAAEENPADNDEDDGEEDDKMDEV